MDTSSQQYAGRIQTAAQGYIYVPYSRKFLNVKIFENQLRLYILKIIFSKTTDHVVIQVW